MRTRHIGHVRPPNRSNFSAHGVHMHRCKQGTTTTVGQPFFSSRQIQHCGVCRVEKDIDTGVDAGPGTGFDIGGTTFVGGSTRVSEVHCLLCTCECGNVSGRIICAALHPDSCWDNSRICSSSCPSILARASVGADGSTGQNSHGRDTYVTTRANMDRHEKGCEAALDCCKALTASRWARREVFIDRLSACSCMARTTHWFTTSSERPLHRVVEFATLPTCNVFCCTDGLPAVDGAKAAAPISTIPLCGNVIGNCGLGIRDWGLGIGD
jgi:hypothetical protein